MSACVGVPGTPQMRLKAQSSMFSQVSHKHCMCGRGSICQGRWGRMPDTRKSSNVVLDKIKRLKRAAIILLKRRHVSCADGGRPVRHQDAPREATKMVSVYVNCEGTEVILLQYLMNSFLHANWQTIFNISICE